MAPSFPMNNTVSELAKEKPWNRFYEFSNPWHDQELGLELNAALRFWSEELCRRTSSHGRLFRFTTDGKLVSQDQTELGKGSITLGDAGVIEAIQHLLSELDIEEDLPDISAQVANSVSNDLPAHTTSYSNSILVSGLTFFQSSLARLMPSVLRRGLAKKKVVVGIDRSQQYLADVALCQRSLDHHWKGGTFASAVLAWYERQVVSNSSSATSNTLVVKPGESAEVSSDQVRIKFTVSESDGSVDIIVTNLVSGIQASIKIQVRDVVLQSRVVPGMPDGFSLSFENGRLNVLRSLR